MISIACERNRRLLYLLRAAGSRQLSPIWLQLRSAVPSLVPLKGSQSTNLASRIRFSLTLMAGVLAVLVLAPSLARAQGSLTPPGAPAPGMKTLAQIEPRTAIASAPFVISAPGSYYLTTNVTVGSGDALTIATNDVTLDLNGFTIASTASSATGNGIYLSSGTRDITISNGHIRGGVTNNGSGSYSGSGFGNGISAYDAATMNVLVSRVSVFGCLFSGIQIGNGNSTVESCVVRTAGNYGISASTIKSSIGTDCGNNAIAGGLVVDCRGECRSSSGSGVYATLAQNCYGRSGSGYGVYATTAQNCYGYSGSSYGLLVTTAHNCYGYSGSGTGIYANLAQTCYGASDGGGYGMFAADVANTSSGYSATGTGLSANIATACRGTTSSGTGQSVTYKYNMP